ncbi:MAG: hypothetical protein Q9208_004143 [Pyrenodesmia sp. 3 TL-2023]
MEDLESSFLRWSHIENTVSTLDGLTGVEEQQRKLAPSTLESIAKSSLPLVPNDLNESVVLRCINDMEAKRKDLAEANMTATEAQSVFSNGVSRFKDKQVSSLVLYFALTKYGRSVRKVNSYGHA